MNEKRLWKLFLLPSLGGVLVFYLLPFVLSLYYGMIDNMGSRQFVGLQNVVETLNSPMFLQAAGNTAGYLGLSIPLILLLSLGLAFLLHRGNRTLLFALLVPLVLPSGVTAFFWNAIFSAGGLINKMLYLLGLPLVNWKTSAVAIVIPVILFLWKNTGLITAIMLIGYSRIPWEYYEIATGEGATPRICFYKVTLPYLAPTLFLSFRTDRGNSVLQGVSGAVYPVWSLSKSPPLSVAALHEQPVFQPESAKAFGGITHSLCADGSSDFTYLFDAEAVKRPIYQRGAFPD